MLTARASAAALPPWKSASSFSVATGKYALLSLPHAGPGSALVIRVVVPCNMQCSMYDQTCQLFAHRNAIAPCIHPRHIRADVSVTNGGHSSSCRSHSERYDIGCIVVSQILLVQPGDCCTTDECHR